MRFRGIVFTLLVLGSSASVVQSQTIDPEFSFKGDTYTAEYALFCAAPHLSKSQMMDILFEEKHVHEYMGKFNLTITKLLENDTMSRVKLEYNYLVATMRMEVVRNRNPQGSNVDFVMKRYERTKKILPVVTYTKGDYRVEKKNGGWVVHYSNKVSMDQEIGGTYASIIKRETRQYLRDLREYIEKYNAPAKHAPTKKHEAPSKKQATPPKKK